MSGSPQKYGFINAKLRTRISLILDETALSRIARTATLVEALGLLRETPYSAVNEVYTKTGDLRLAELELIKTEINLYRDLLKATHGDIGTLITALIGRFEGENLKAALRLWFDRHIRGRDIAGESSYLITDSIRSSIHYERMLQESDPDEAARLLSHTPFYPCLRDHLPAAAAKKSLFDVEVALDHLFFQELYQASAQLSRADREIADAIIGAEVDLRNVAWLVRSRTYPDLTTDEVMSAMIPGGSRRISRSELEATADKTDPLAAVLSLIDNHYPGVSIMVKAAGGNDLENLNLLESLFNEVMKRQASKILLLPPFSVGVILAYFILKGREVDSLITILNAKYYEMDESRIKEIL